MDGARKREWDQTSDVAVAHTFSLRDLECVGAVGGELGEPAPAANNGFQEERVDLDASRWCCRMRTA